MEKWMNDNTVMFWVRMNEGENTQELQWQGQGMVEKDGQLLWESCECKGSGEAFDFQIWRNFNFVRGQEE